MLKGIAILFLVILGIGWALDAAETARMTPEQRAAKAAEDATRKRLVEEAERRHTRIFNARYTALPYFRDPDSVKWGDAYISQTNAVCTEFNAKNGFGGYTGKDLAILGVFTEPVTLGQYCIGQRCPDAQAKQFKALWAKHCQR